MHNTKLLIGSLALMMLLASCGKQTAPSVSPEDTRDLNSANDLDRMGLNQSDNNIDSDQSGPSIDITLPIENISESPNIDSNINLTEWDTYMIVPGDFLISIASAEYGNFRKWQEIYSWNKEQIGDNPNLIYPYHYLTLKRENKVEEYQPGFSPYEVSSGETLWKIAEKLYGDPVAWIILYLDNSEKLNGNGNFLDPGMKLQVRDNIDPKT